MNITLKNKSLSVEISTLGAEMQAVTLGKKEYLWNGDPKFWTGRAPVMFPICGGLMNDVFFYEGKQYTLGKHGYAKLSEFEVEKKEEARATFLLKSTEQSKTQFPFDYEFRITYTLNEDAITVGYNIKNLTDGKMYFSVGSHEAYACPEGIEEYSVIFDEEETIGSYILDGNLLEYNQIPILNREKELKLNYKYFAIDALCFKDVKSRGATLVHKKNGKKARVEFPGADYLFIWTKPNAPYICIEPWCGIPDSIDSTKDLTKKEGINKLEKGETFERIHTITLFE
jgi:Galactose mutarotase and related enzymes